MNESKHAPAQWEFHIGRWPNGELHGRPYIYAPNGPDTHRHIAEVCVDGTAPPEIQAMQEANGRLLAQAPDLIKQRDALAEALNAIANDNPGTDKFALMAIARATLALVEGGK